MKLPDTQHRIREPSVGTSAPVPKGALSVLLQVFPCHLLDFLSSVFRQDEKGVSLTGPCGKGLDCASPCQLSSLSPLSGPGSSVSQFRGLAPRRGADMFNTSSVFPSQLEAGGGGKASGNVFNIEWSANSMMFFSARKLTTFNGIHQQFKWYCCLFFRRRNFELSGFASLSAPSFCVWLLPRNMRDPVTLLPHSFTMANCRGPPIL